MLILQINLQHCKAATALLAQELKKNNRYDIVLIQEPWVFRGQVRGLGGLSYDVIFRTSETEPPRACILVKKTIQYLTLNNLCFRDLITIKFQLEEAGIGTRNRELVLCSAYCAHEEPSPPNELDDVIKLAGPETSIIIGADANAQNESWGSTKDNQRGESLLNYLVANNLITLNVGSRPTFITRSRREVLDVTMGTPKTGVMVSNWRVLDKNSGSDHAYIEF